MKFTKIPAKTFQQLQMNGGVLMSDFNPTTGQYNPEAQIGATSGGITFNATPSYTDFGEDIDNCPKNMKELKKLESWEVICSGSFVTMNTKVAKSMLGAADIDGSDATKIKPRNEVLASDFADLWIVGDYSDINDDTNGGHIAIHMMNALSTSGFEIKTTDKAKGQFAFEYTAHYSMDAQDTPPFEIYIKAGAEN